MNHPLPAAEARELAEADPASLRGAAEEVRDRAFGRSITWSPKVFLPITRLCRDRCDYCSFRRSPDASGIYTMSLAEIRAEVARAAAAGCVEALICIGDTPETTFPRYRAFLAENGFHATVDFLHAAAQIALDAGLVPHTNAGLLSEESLTRLRAVNASQGIMLETTSERLLGAGQPHRRAPDKRPAVRLAMLEAAGRQRVPFTTGLLVGIGETPLERVDTLLAIRDSHRRWGHIQEVIVQNFRAGAATPMSGHPEPSDPDILRTVSLARLILDREVSVQAPPNLNPGAIEALVAAGINDLGGISPVTPDFINPGHPWPEISLLEARLGAMGFQLRPRLPVYPHWNSREFQHGDLEPALAAAGTRLDASRSAA